MRLRLMQLVLIIVAAYGCSSSNRGSGMSASASDPESSADPTLLSPVATQIDSAEALLSFGDVNEYFTVRDSVEQNLKTITTDYPSIRYEPEFKRILKSLSDLDSIVTANGHAHTYLEETDSLALATQHWPETDTPRTMRSVEAGGDTLFPTIKSERIDFWTRYYTGPGKELFARALYRMELYRPLIEDIYDEMGIPEELICLGIIESGFQLKARSYAKAVGPWQFIAGTARIYGLRVNWWFDERRDIVASTYASCNYLGDLYGIWNDWLLALAAYNCGEYRVARAVARHKTTDFWQLDLPRQTERYVPKFLAVLYILRDPQRYGFELPDVEPIKFDEVVVKDATDFRLIAKSAGTTVDVLQDLNPCFFRWCTPPGVEVHVKVPPGSGEVCQTALDNIPPDERVTWRKHRIRNGETLSRIASRYGTTVTTLKDLNGIRNAHRIRAGQYLIVPVEGAFTEVAVSSTPQYKTKHRTIDRDALEKYAQRYAAPADHSRTVYIVKDGDTLGEIAELYHTSARRLRYWNNLSYRSYIYPGQKIVIYVPSSFDLGSVPSGARRQPTGEGYVKSQYTVKKGDTFYSISRRYNVRLVDLLAWNNKSSRSTLYPGQVLDIWEKK